ncbi:hypothetical protein [Anaerosporobacter faecicola]|uniref:hypothetical protein n=1 Tax=Anaerosporobacter faecicola TaxID=2718714 RepID=UPI00143C1297|nr:hypothetical protein [Anaerosporobacter faecicola]
MKKRIVLFFILCMVMISVNEQVAFAQNDKIEVQDLPHTYSTKTTKTITVKKAEDAIAEQIDQVLMSKTALTLKVKGNKENANKIVKAL